MPVKVAKLWSNVKFQALDQGAKLLYLYLATNPGISILGVCSPNLNVVCAELGVDLDELRDYATQLVEGNYISTIAVDEVVYFIVPEHFNTAPKSDSTVLRINKEFKVIPQELADHLIELDITVDRKVNVFKAPTVEEVRLFALQSGYNISADQVVEYYEQMAKRYNKPGKWVDGRGKEVKDWKAKLRVVWFKDERKLKAVSGAPEGFEYFHIVKNGNMIFPDRWVNGQPKSKDFAVNAEMLKKFKELQ